MKICALMSMAPYLRRGLNLSKMHSHQLKIFLFCDNRIYTPFFHLSLSELKIRTCGKLRSSFIPANQVAMLNAESLQIILHKYITVENRLCTLVLNLDYSCDQSESPKVNQIRAPIFLSLASHVPKVARPTSTGLGLFSTENVLWHNFHSKTNHLSKNFSSH